MSTPIEGANAWILEAAGEDVLLIGPPGSDVDLGAGDLVVFEGRFAEFQPAQLDAIEGVGEESAITDAFDGKYVVIAQTVERLDS